MTERDHRSHLEQPERSPEEMDGTNLLPDSLKEGMPPLYSQEGGVLIVEMDRNRCQNGPGLDTILHQGVAHADVHCRSMSSLSLRSSGQTRQNRPRHPALPVPE